MNAMQCVQASDQMMQAIIEDHRDELDRFVYAPSNEYAMAQSFISFALARHFALKAATGEATE